MKRAPKKKPALDELLLVGQMLSNVAYNLAQDERHPDRRLLQKLVERWDAAQKQLRVTAPTGEAKNGGGKT